MKTIEEEAISQGLSVNTLVNQLLTKYAKVNRLMAKTKGIRLTHETIKEIFESVPEDKVVEIARKTGSGITHENEILALTGSSAAEKTIIEFLKIMAEFNAVDYVEVKHDGITSMSFTHNISRNFSVYFANKFATSFEAAGSFPKISFDDRVVRFEFS